MRARWPCIIAPVTTVLSPAARSRSHRRTRCDGHKSIACVELKWAGIAIWTGPAIAMACAPPPALVRAESRSACHGAVCALKRRAVATSVSLRTVHLPDATEVQAFDRNEALFLWEEVYRSQCYLKPGLINLRAGDTVVDVGAVLAAGWDVSVPVRRRPLPLACTRRHAQPFTSCVSPGLDGSGWRACWRVCVQLAQNACPVLQAQTSACSRGRRSRRSGAPVPSSPSRRCRPRSPRYNRTSQTPLAT